MRNQTRLLNTFFFKLPFLVLTVLGTLTWAGFTVDINSPDATTSLSSFPSPAHFCSQQMLSQADHLTDLFDREQRVIFQVWGQTLCTAMWPVVPAVEDMCSWDLTSDSSLPRLAFLRCESALSVKRPLKCWSKTWQCFSCLNEQITVGYHNSDKNCRCPLHIRTEGTEVESS